MPLNIILFDLDGTLVDTAPDLAGALDHALHGQGRKPVGLDSVRNMVGDGAVALVERGLEATGGIESDAQFKAAVAAFFEYYGANLARTSRPFPGVITCLEGLKRDGYKLAVCTNKTEGFSRSLLDQLGMTPLFDAIVGGDTLPVKKPDAGHITGTVEKVGGDAGWVAMVGDSANDINAAKAAGIPSVVVSFGYTRIAPAELGADRLIDHFDDLRAALEALRAESRLSV